MAAKLFLAAAVLLICALTAFGDTAVKCTFKTLDACPKIGCAKPDTPTAVANGQKRTVTNTGSPAKISFDNLQDLQTDVEKNPFPMDVAGEKVKSYRSMKAAPRKILLSGLPTGGKKFSEGDFVELTGFIASEKQKPHPNKGETVNCKFTDEPRNDYHISVTPTKNSDETKGVVVEMIPQNPHRKHKDWNLDKLRKIQDKQFAVKIEGRLFFDSEHTPNTSKTSTSKQPRRFSLWEIHPVSSFFVCDSGTCTSSGWKALEDWTPSP